MSYLLYLIITINQCPKPPSDLLQSPSALISPTFCLEKSSPSTVVLFLFGDPWCFMETITINLSMEWYITSYSAYEESLPSAYQFYHCCFFSQETYSWPSHVSCRCHTFGKSSRFSKTRRRVHHKNIRQQIDWRENKVHNYSAWINSWLGYGSWRGSYRENSFRYRNDCGKTSWRGIQTSLEVQNIA